MAKVTRKDWKSWLPAKSLRKVDCCFAFTEDEYRLIEAGCLAESFDGHWNILEEEGRLYIYRSWTSTLAYEVLFVKAGGHRVARSILATTDKEVYAVPEKDVDAVADVWNVINTFLLKKHSPEDFAAVAAAIPGPPGGAGGLDADRFMAERTAYYLARARTCEKLGLKAGAIPEPTVVTEHVLEFSRSSRAPRLLAFVLDTTPFMAAYVAALLGASNPWATALVGVGYLAYHVLALSLFGTTLGKWTFGLKVIDASGNKPRAGRALARTVGYLPSSLICNLGFFWSFWDPEGRAWHDMLSRTWVVPARTWSPAIARLQSWTAWLTGMAFAFAWLFLIVGLPKLLDLDMVAQAKNGLESLGAFEEKYRGVHGRYTEDLQELGKLSGDEAAFGVSLLKLFDDKGFRIEAGTDTYRIEAAARDSQSTPIFYERPSGPR